MRGIFNPCCCDRVPLSSWKKGTSSFAVITQRGPGSFVAAGLKKNSEAEGTLSWFRGPWWQYVSSVLASAIDASASSFPAFRIMLLNQATS